MLVMDARLNRQLLVVYYGFRCKVYAKSENVQNLNLLESILCLETKGQMKQCKQRQEHELNMDTG
jgi:hypothetical protein